MTGGVVGRLADKAIRGSITASRAVRTTAAVGGTANAAGTIISNGLDGNATTLTEVLTAGSTGAVEAGIGAKFSNNMAQTLDDFSRASNAGQHLADTTRSAFIGRTAATKTSIGAETGKIASDTIANMTQKELNQ